MLYIEVRINDNKTVYIMEMEFIGSPVNEEHYPNKYKAVLLINGEISQMLPHESDISVDDFLYNCKELAKDYGEELVIK